MKALTFEVSTIPVPVQKCRLIQIPAAKPVLIRADIEQKGYISPYQYWFGCWYLDEPEFLDWDGYRSYFKNQGFNWLEEKEKTT